MKPSTCDVARRLGLAGSYECRHDWRMHGHLHAYRGPRRSAGKCIAYKCANCGDIKHEPLSRRFG